MPSVAPIVVPTSFTPVAAVMMLEPESAIVPPDTSEIFAIPGLNAPETVMPAVLFVSPTCSVPAVMFVVTKFPAPKSTRFVAALPTLMAVAAVTGATTTLPPAVASTLPVRTRLSALRVIVPPPDETVGVPAPIVSAPAAAFSVTSPPLLTTCEVPATLNAPLFVKLKLPLVTGAVLFVTMTPNDCDKRLLDAFVRTTSPSPEKTEMVPAVMDAV